MHYCGRMQKEEEEIDKKLNKEFYDFYNLFIFYVDDFIQYTLTK